MRRVVVTGAAGRIGSAVCELLTAEGIAVRAVMVDEGTDLDVERVFVGDAADPVLMRAACADADGVVHLAALPSPALGTPQEVYLGNVAATFTVLEEAGAQGVRHAVIASSINALGLGYSPRDDASPAYLPWDEHAPTIAADPYSMSKWTDEFIADSMARRHDMTVAALRFPLTAAFDTSLPPAEAHPGFADVATGRTDLWMYLEVHDAARAVLAGLQLGGGPGAHPIFVAAPNSWAPHPTEQLLDRFWPGIERRRRFEGDQVPVDLARAEQLLGFRAERVFQHTITDLPADAAGAAKGADR